MRANDQSASIIVMEYGSRWPVAVVQEQPDAASVTAIVQQPDELAATLKQRAIRRVAAIGSRGAALQSGILSCNENADEETWASRALIARAMLASIISAGQGQLILSAHRGISYQARSGLVALAEALRSVLGGTQVSVAVSFA